MVFTSRDADKAQDLFQTLQRVGPPMGIRFDEPMLAELPNDRTQTFLQGIEEHLTRETQMVRGRCEAGMVNNGYLGGGDGEWWFG